MPKGVDRFRSATEACQSVVLDTNACIYFLEGGDSRADLVGALLRRAGEGTLRVNLPGIVEFELMVKPYQGRDVREIMRAQNFVLATRGVRPLAMSREIMLTSAEVRAATQMRVPDALVVGSAIVAQCDAIVGNDVRFKTIDRLAEHRWLSAAGRNARIPAYVHIGDFEDD